MSLLYDLLLENLYIVILYPYYLSNYSFSLFGGFSNFEEVIAKFGQLTPQERAKRCN